MLRAQQVEALDRFAHQPGRLHARTSALGIERGLAQVLLALRDLHKAALERVVGAERVVYGDASDDHRQRRQPADQVIDPQPARQPLLQFEIDDAGAVHISNFAILTMTKTPNASIPKAMPTSTSPRTSVNKGMM